VSSRENFAVRTTTPITKTGSRASTPLTVDVEDYPYKPYSTLQNILCCHEAEKQNGHHSPYFII
jgi:hypothetical protein